MTRDQKIFVGVAVAGIFLFSSKRSSGSSSLDDGMMGEHFSVDEFISSNTCEAHGIDNTPEQWQVENGIALARYVLDPVRSCLEGPVKVNSWFRNYSCNNAVGGVPGSEHTDGGTADIEFFLDGMQRNDLIMRCLLSTDIPFDRVLLEHGDWKNPSWVHVEYDNTKDPEDQRRIVWVINNGTHGYEMPPSDMNYFL